VVKAAAAKEAIRVAATLPRKMTLAQRKVVKAERKEVKLQATLVADDIKKTACDIRDKKKAFKLAQKAEADAKRLAEYEAKQETDRRKVAEQTIVAEKERKKADFVSKGFFPYVDHTEAEWIHAMGDLLDYKSLREERKKALSDGGYLRKNDRVLKPELQLTVMSWKQLIDEDELHFAFLKEDFRLESRNASVVGTKRRKSVA
jgi:hypothetical protein